MGNSHLNTLLVGMNVPEYYSSTFKIHEKEVGLAAGQYSLETCAEMARIERELTVRHFEEIKKLL